MSRFDLSRDDLAALFEGEPSYRVEQLWRALHLEHLDVSEVTTLPRHLRRRLELEPALAPAWRVARESASDGGATRKWLLEAADGARVETVLMAYRRRTTVCVSSQAGCAMGCSFCATGQLGFGRHLSSGEIVEQVVLAAAEAGRAGFGRLGNVVFMGMGEPLANATNVLGAVARLNRDLGIGARSVTLSTVGVVPGIERLAAEPLQVNLAVSLHAANDELRDRLVPVNRRYPLGRLMEACRRYRQATGRRISFEWALIAGVNDRPADAAELAALARPLGAHVNLIPLNPTPGYPVAGTGAAGVAAFRGALSARGVNATVRHTRGREVDAACGQLAAGMQVGGLGRRRPVRVAAPAPLA